MIRALLFALLFPVVVTAEPDDRFFSAYILLQQGDTAEATGDWATAHAKFTAALTTLTEIKAQTPAWHPDLVAFRRQYCLDKIAALTPQLPAGVTPVVTVAPPPAPPVDTAPAQQLQTELQEAQAAVKSLTAQRDKLAAELQAKLNEPAPTDRETAKETLAQLRSMQAANAATTAKLAAAEEKAARADQLASELEQSQKKLQELDRSREVLTTQLQEALAKVAEAQTSPQVEQLLKKNQEATAQLAEAQAEIAKLRDQVLTNTNAMPAAEAIQLRGELLQTRALLESRTEELAKLQTENNRLTAAQAESDRQLRAAKVAGEKGDQLIQQLRKENELLRQITARQGTSPDPLAKPKPATGGFLWFKPKAKPAPAAPTNDVTTSQSDAGKLTVSVKSPVPSESAKAEAVEVKSAAEAVTDAKEGTAEVRLLVGQALTAMAAKDYAAAKPFLVTAVAKDPGNLSVLLNLGITLYQLNETDEALTTLRQVVAGAPNQSAARSLMGIIHLRQGRIEDAYNELTRTVAIEPRNAEAHNYLGIVMNQKGWSTAAEQEIRRALELNPNYADAHFNLAVLYSRQKTPRLELARYHYQKAIEFGSGRDPELEAVLKSAAVPPK